MEIVQIIFYVCIIPMLGILTKFIIDFLSAKKNEIKNNTENETTKKYIEMIYETVTKCVIATNQTYVESLKQAGKFDAAAQEEAFKRTLEAVLAILNDDVIEYMEEIVGDIVVYLTELIEAAVNM